MLARSYRRLRKRLSAVRMLARYVRALGTVQVRRRRRGPLRRGWTARFEAFVELLRNDTGRLRGFTAADIRARMAPLPSKVLGRVEITPARGDGAPNGEWIVPRGTATRGTLLYLHGGGYICGSPRTHRDLLARLALAAHVRVFALDYRLAPEHPFPAAVDDAHGAYR